MGNFRAVGRRGLVSPLPSERLPRKPIELLDCIFRDSRATNETLRMRIRTASDIAPNRHVLHPFDAQYGTDTGDYMLPRDLTSGSEHDSLNYGYSAIAPSVFREALARWRDTLPGAARRLSAYTFVDVGAGKGRALLLAAET